MPKAQDFFEQAFLQETDECIMWPHSRFSSGYGLLVVGGRADKKYKKAHRMMCQRAHGDPPTEAHEAAHSCHNKPCINKRHLSWKTHAENMADSRGDARLNGWATRREREKLYAIR